jgi:hypothetical protein
MKEVPKKDLPEISGGEDQVGSCIPYPGLPSPDDGTDYPRNPFNPVYESPYSADE